MLTLKHIEEANNKVKSGADFPRLAQDLIDLGVKTNDVYVCDGHAEYFDAGGTALKTNAIYSLLEVADESKPEEFTHYLKIHQAGETDYPTFCCHSAETGVEKWTLDFTEMTCTYLDKKGKKLLVEKIPSL